MNCRKCGCELFEGTIRCPMCDAKQRGSNKKQKADKTENQEMLMGSGKQPSDSNVVAVTIFLVILAVVSVGFVLFNVVDFDSIERETLIESVESSNDSVESNTEDANLRSIGRGSHIQGANDHLFFLNQMNDFASNGRIYLTDDFIYLSTPFASEIAVFDRYFNEESTFMLRDDWARIIRYYVVDDAIYYTAGSDGELYRYDRDTQTQQHLASNIFHQTVAGDQIFYLNDRWDASNLYVFDKDSGETSVVFVGDIRQFSVNILDETIIFMENRSLYQIDFSGDNLEQLIDDAWGFAFDGYMLAWYTGAGEIFAMDINTGEEARVTQEVDPHALILTEDYIIFTDWFDDLYKVNRDSNDLQHLSDDVVYFSVVGDYIIYEKWSDYSSLHIMDFNGNSRLLIDSGWD